MNVREEYQRVLEEHQQEITAAGQLGVTYQRGHPRSTLDNEFQATSAAAGWGGGRIAVYSNELQPDRVLVHIALIWDDRQEAREFLPTFVETVPLIAPEPDIRDPSSPIFAWTASDVVWPA